MSYLALYRKYRPTTFDGMVGQRAVITALQNQVKYGQVGHAYLFCGTRGTGKTSTAKVFARAVNCLHSVDGNPCNECELCREAESSFHLVEIDAASNNGVENIRDLREEVQYTPTKGRYKVYIIDEVHMLTQSAFNALLKTLEEPPAHVIFILATTEPHKVLPTILSRCQRYDFKRITVQEITEHLAQVCEKEGIRAEEAALHYIAALADGGMRDALSILDQCHAYYINEEITLARVQDVLGAVDSRIFTQMTAALAQEDAAALLTLIQQMFAEGRDVLQFVSTWSEYLRNVLVSQVLKDQAEGLIETDPEQLERIQRQAGELSAEQLTWYIESLAKLEAKLKSASEKRIILEVGLLGLLRERSAERPERLQEAPSYKAPVRAPERQQQSRRQETIPAVPALKQAEQKTPVEGAAKGTAEQQAVIQRWPEIRKKISTQWQSLYTLNLMRLEAGAAADELVLRASKAIYCQQLEMKGGEKLSLIEEQIEEATGSRYRVRVVSDERPRIGSGDLSDIKNQIHTDVNWRNE